MGRIPVCHRPQVRSACVAASPSTMSRERAIASSCVKNVSMHVQTIFPAAPVERDPSASVHEVEGNGMNMSLLAALPGATAGESVIIVDDEAAVREVIMDVMQELGYRTTVAATAAVALSALRTAGRVHLMITDVGLPGGMNGRQLAVAARVEHPDLKVLFISGDTEDAVFGAGQLQTGMEVLSKPFDLDALARRSKLLTDSTP